MSDSRHQYEELFLLYQRVPLDIVVKYVPDDDNEEMVIIPIRFGVIFKPSVGECINGDLILTKSKQNERKYIYLCICT